MVVLLLTGCASDDAGGVEPRRTESTPPVTTPGATTSAEDGGRTTTTVPPPDGELVTVEAVLDGDSLAVTRNGRRTEVRLAGINAPEADECYGDAARRLTQSLASEQVVLVTVDGDDDQDQFGRLLRNVWVGGTWINLELVRQGAALALQTGTNQEAELVAAEDAAWRSGSGMWGSSVCGEFTEGMRITDIRYDPPGRDFENKVEEFVLLANEGDQTIDLSGWIVRDESSTHRYTFTPGFTLAAGDGVRLRSGCGEDGRRDLHWCADDAVWSNGGDTVILQTSTGTVVDRWKFPGDY